jgi:PAS domain S-box-containing protein
VAGKASPGEPPHGSVDRWYFHHANEAEPAPGAAPPAAQDNRPAENPAPPVKAARKTGSGAAPVKFVWRTGADGRFTSISEEFASALGEASADVIGRSFREVAEAFGFDEDGEIAALLERRDTWSGRSVLWPIASAAMRVPVDLAALPVYGRDRSFQGFRGFGVARMGDAVAAPEPVARAVEQARPAGEPNSTGKAEDKPAAPTTGESGAAAQETRDPFRGEVPALAIVPQPERRYSDKIIRLAEHRPAAPAEEGLSQTERNAFREIGARLRKESDKQGEPGGPPPAGNDASGETAADKVLPIARETFGKRDWLKLSAPNPDRSESAPESPDLHRTESGTATEAEAAETTGRAGAIDDPVSDAANTEAVTPAEGAAEGAVEHDDGASTGENALAENATAEEAEAPSPADDETAPEESDAVEKSAAAHSTPAPETARPAEEPENVIPLASVSADPASPLSTAEAEGEADEEAGAAAQPDLYEMLLSNLPTPVLVHSGDELHYANDEFLRLTGYPSLGAIRSAGGLGELFADPYETEDAAGDRRLRLKTASGETLPIEALLQSVPWKGGKALMLALRPAAQPSAGQAEIRQLPLAEPAPSPDADARLDELRAIIDTATDGVVLISPEGTIRSISRPAEALFGFDSDEVAGKPFAALFAIESQRAAQDYLQGLSDHGVASVLNDGREVIGREAQGRFIPLFMTIGRLPGDSGFCAVLRDVKQWKGAEEELTQARAQAEVASSQKTEFLARVSHEIRTPLNAIIGFSELMIDEKFGPIGNDRYRDYLRDINRSGNHVLDLVNDLLDISKIEAGEQEMNYEAVSLNDTLAETVAMMQPQANRERVIIRSSFPSRLPEVVADLRSVRQIALNLLSNAIHYTQAGGQVIVSTSYEASGDIVMRVRDTGIGMSQAEIEQAMKPFKQVNALKRPRGDGTGLGLPLTKAMVEANRARFSISSTPGEGTLVEVTFPSTRVLAD